MSISDPEYLYRITFIDATTLPDGTKGDLVLTTKAVRMEGSIDVDRGTPIGIQGPNSIGVQAALYDPTLVAAGQSIADARFIPKSLSINTTNGTKKVYVDFGLELDVDIEALDKEGNAVSGSISYSVYDLDVEARQESWGRPVGLDAAERFKYAEGITINDGALSYAVYPNYDHQYEEYVTYGAIRTPSSCNPGTNTYTFYDSPMIVSRVGSGSNANGTRFHSVGERKVRDSNGTYNNNGYVNGDGYTEAPNTNKHYSATGAEYFNNVIRNYDGAYLATRTDANTYDTGFAVLLDSTGSSFTWSGSNYSNGPMGTTLFSTKVFIHVEQTHGTGGGIYLEGYPLTGNAATSCVPNRYEGTVTMGSTSDATMTLVPEDGYRVKEIYVAGKKFEIVEEDGVEKLKLPNGTIRAFGATSDTYQDTNGNDVTRTIAQGVRLTRSVHGITGMTDLIIEKNDNGTYDVTLKKITSAKHIHVDFTADYYFYKVWKGQKAPTSLKMTATPFAFVF